MRPRVAGMVWLPKDELSPDLIKHLRKELTIIPRKAFGYDDEPAQPVRCYQETPFEFGVPRSFWFGTATKPYEYEWDISFGEEWESPPECCLTHEGPYAEQGEVISLFDERFWRSGPDCTDDEEPSDREAGLLMGGIFQADTGFGKTDTTLGLINRLQRTTLIIVHKEFLQTQWVARAEKWLPGVKIGVVRENRCDFEDKHIVVAMAQSLALEDGNRYPNELYSWPALLVIDETHRVAAPTWAPLPPRFSSAWRLGLTATPRRKDGADNVFWWHIGPIVYKAKTETPKPKIRMIKVKSSLPDVARRQTVKAPIVINILTRVKKRDQVLVSEMVKALEAPAERKLFILSERLDHLRRLEEALRGAWAAKAGEELTTGFYTGDWFTGDVRPKLAARSWPMKDGGRERAIEAIYRSMARRWVSLVGEENAKDELKPCILTDKKTMEKSHSLILSWGHVAAIQGIVTDPDDDQEWVHLVLEDLADVQLYDMAAMFGICQKKVEKKRRQTRDELHEAERARVIFACVTDDVECLTLDGWKSRADLRVGELVASYSMERGVIEYEPLLEVKGYDFDGELAYIDRRRISVGMTWNHRNVVSRQVKKDGRVFRVEQIVEANELTSHDKIRVMAPMDYQASGSIGVELAELVGWVISEGSFVNDKWGGVVIYQNEGDSASRIDGLLASLGISHRRSEYRPRQISWHIKEEDAAPIKDVCPDKRLLRPLVDLPVDELRGLFRGLVDGDGHRRRDDGRVSFVQKDPVTIDWFTVLAMRLGYTPLVSPKEGGGWVVYLTEVTHVGLHDREFHVKSMSYSGKVWCPRTGNGTWVARSASGGIFITGNTYQMCAEGVDLPAIDTEFLASPIADVEQAVGRVRRNCLPEPKKCEHFCPWRAGKCEGKPQTVVCDLVDMEVPLASKRERYRRDFYDSLGTVVAG